MDPFIEEKVTDVKVHEQFIGAPFVRIIHAKYILKQEFIQQQNTLESQTSHQRGGKEKNTRAPSITNLLNRSREPVSAVSIRKKTIHFGAPF